MKSNIYFPGSEQEGVIIEYYSPNEFYCSFTEENEYIRLSESDDSLDSPEKSEVLQHKKFMIRVGDENVLCEVISDLKNEENYCQVLLCNTSVKLKVNYQSLRHLNEKITNEDIVALKINDLAPMFPNSWNNELITQMKGKVLYQRFIVQFKSSKFDPADGRYPVNLLDVSTRKSIAEPFINDKLAVRYCEYFEQWLDYERRRIFDDKEKEPKKYIVSSPMFKKYPTRNAITNCSPKPKLNVEAQPFTPNLSKRQSDVMTPKSLTLDSSFVFDKLPTPLNGSLYGPATESLHQQPHVHSFETLERNGTLRSQHSEESEPAFTPDGSNASKRIKRGLEVVSPSSKRKIINSSVHRGSPLTTSVHVLPADCQRFVQQWREEATNYEEVTQRNSPAECKKHGVTADFREDNTSEDLENQVQDVGSSFIQVNNVAPVHMSSNPSKKYPGPFGAFNYPIMASPFSFQPYTLQNMYMLQSMLRPQMAPESILHRSGLGSNSFPRGPGSQSVTSDNSI